MGRIDEVKDVTNTMAIQIINKRGNVTNGDVIKAMFPSAKIFIDERGNYHYVYVNNPNMGATWKIREDWWNSPYKEWLSNGSKEL